MPYIVPVSNYWTWTKSTTQKNVFFWSNSYKTEVIPSRKILVPRTSRERPPPTSPGRPLKILFDRPGDVPIWHPGAFLRWRPEDVLIWRSRDVPRRSPGRPLEDLESTQTWMSKLFLNFSFRTYSIDQI